MRICSENLHDGDPDSLAFIFGLDDFLLEAVEPDAAVNDLTHELVLAYEDATFGVLGGVASVDADALPLAVELGATKENG